MSHTASLDVRYRIAYAAVLAPRARRAAEKLTIAGFLLANCRTEQAGNYRIVPERADVISCKEIEQEVCPTRK